MKSDSVYLVHGGAKFLAFNEPKRSGWRCYLFGNKPGGSGFVWSPSVDEVPNAFVRYMMRVCLGCRWERVE